MSEATKNQHKNLARTPIEEISVDDMRYELQARRAQRWPKLAAQIFAGLSGLLLAAAALVKAFGAGDTAEANRTVINENALLIEYRLTEEVKAREALEVEMQRDREFAAAEREKLRERLERVRLKLTTCCPGRDDR